MRLSIIRLNYAGAWCTLHDTFSLSLLRGRSLTYHGWGELWLCCAVSCVYNWARVTCWYAVPSSRRGFYIITKTRVMRRRRRRRSHHACAPPPVSAHMGVYICISVCVYTRLLPLTYAWKRCSYTRRCVFVYIFGVVGDTFPAFLRHFFVTIIGNKFRWFKIKRACQFFTSRAQICIHMRSSLRGSAIDLRSRGFSKHATTASLMFSSELKVDVMGFGTRGCDV